MVENMNKPDINKINNDDKSQAAPVATDANTQKDLNTTEDQVNNLLNGDKNTGTDKKEGGQTDR